MGKHAIYFYKDKSGKEPVLEYLKELLSQNGKDSHIKAAKIQDYINILSEHGTKIGEPYIKHIEGEIWELRPLRDRIFFVAWPYHVNRQQLCPFAPLYEENPKDPKQRNRKGKTGTQQPERTGITPRLTR